MYAVHFRLRSISADRAGRGNLPVWDLILDHHHDALLKMDSGGAYKLSLQPPGPQEHDPLEQTARPGNAQRHAMWLMDQGPAGESGHNDTDGDDDNNRGGDEYSSVTTPGLSKGLSRPLTQQEQERLAHLDRLKFFLATAPSGWEKGNVGGSSGSNSYAPDPAHPALNRFLLPSQEFVTCVLWNGLYHITGTDIVRALVFRCVCRAIATAIELTFAQIRGLRPPCTQYEKVRGGCLQ